MAPLTYLTKRIGVVSLFAVYIAGIICLTIAIISPNWLIGVSLYCRYTGIVFGDCRIPYAANSDIDIYSRVAFYSITTAVCILYTNLMLTALAFMYDGQVLMGFVSVSYGILFPVSAAAILGSSIYLAASNSVDFPAILGIVAGGLLLLFYFCLILYDYHFTKENYSFQMKRTDHKQADRWCFDTLETHSVENQNRYHYKLE